MSASMQRIFCDRRSSQLVLAKAMTVLGEWLGGKDEEAVSYLGQGKK